MGRGPHTVLVRALLRHAGVGSPCGRDPRGSRSSRIPPPPPRVAVPSGGGGLPVGSGGAEGRSCGSQAGGGCGGGGGAPPPPPPSGVGLPFVVPGVPLRGILAPWGLPGGRGRRPRSGRPPTGQCGGGRGGGGGGTPRPWFAPPSSPGRRPAAGRACGRLPRPCCPRTPGAAAFSGGLRGRRFFGLPPSALGPEWEGGGGGSGGGPLVPWRRLLTAGGGAAWRSRPRGPAIGWGVAPFPRPPLSRAGPPCRPSLGPLIPPAVVARRWPAGGGRAG